MWVKAQNQARPRTKQKTSLVENDIYSVTEYIHVALSMPERYHEFDHQNSGGIAGHLSSHFLISSWGVLWHFETSLVLYQLRLQVYISLKQILGHIYIYI